MIEDEVIMKKTVESAVLEKSGFRCSLCRTPNKYSPTRVVRINQKAPEFSVNNLQTLCEMCVSGRPIFDGTDFRSDDQRWVMN